jgi:hypothetical protein
MKKNIIKINILGKSNSKIKDTTWWLIWNKLIW